MKKKKIRNQINNIREEFRKVYEEHKHESELLSERLSGMLDGIEICLSAFEEDDFKQCIECKFYDLHDDCFPCSECSGTALGEEIKKRRCYFVSNRD